MRKDIKCITCGKVEKRHPLTKFCLPCKKIRNLEQTRETQRKSAARGKL